VISQWAHDTPQTSAASLLAAARAPGEPVRVVGVIQGRSPLDLAGTELAAVEGMTTLFTAEVGPGGAAVGSVRPIARLERADLVAELSTPDGGGLVAGPVAGRVTFDEVELDEQPGANLVVARLAADGTTLDARRYGTSGCTLSSVQAAAGPDGRVALAGVFTGQPPWLTGDDQGEYRLGYFVMLVAPDGTPLWTRGWCGGAPLRGGVSDVAVTDDGGVLVVGAADSGAQFAACPQASRDIDDALPNGVYVKRYGPDGTVAWRLGGLGTAPNPPIPVLALGDQGAAALAFSVVGPTSDIAHGRVIRFDAQSGRLRWNAAIDHPTSALTFRPGAEEVLAAGFRWAELGVTRLGAAGELLGTRRYGGMQRLGGASMAFDTPTELALWGAVSDCSPYEGWEVLGPVARSASTSPLYLLRVRVEVP
jgi:hypothetical protein